MLNIAWQRQRAHLENNVYQRPVILHSRLCLSLDNFLGLKRLFWQPFNILLFILPVVLLSILLDWPHHIEFWLCFFALLPLAKIMGDATEEVSNTIESDEIGGLLAATLGNATEITVTLCLLTRGKYEVVKFALFGAVLSCLLFVLGTASFVASVMGCTVQCHIKPLWYALPLVVAASLIIVASVVVFDNSINTELNISRTFSCISILSYGSSLFIQIYARNTMDGDTGTEDMEGKLSEFSEDFKPMSLWLGILCLAVAIVVMALVAELLSDDLDAMLLSTQMSEVFFAIIFLPLIVNVSDAMAATRFAMHDRMDLAVGICLGSSVQLLSFVLPVAVLIAWAFERDTHDRNMTLSFGILSNCLLVISTVVVLIMIVGGKFELMKGAILLIMYVVSAVLLWFFAREA